MNKIAVLGPKYSYCHILAMKTFPEREFLFCQKISEIFRSVAEGKVGQGIVPLENMLNGSVRESIMSLLKYKVKINQAFNFPIHHCLAAQGNKFTKIVSHPQALAQCSGFLIDKEIIRSASTSKAMEIAADDESFAAIGAKEAVKHYGLQVIQENIEDNHDNVTRFVLISNEESENEVAKEKVQTSLVLDPKEDKPGLLFLILAPFAAQNINLMKIESLPSGKKMGEYVFYLEIAGSFSDSNVKAAINFLKESTEVHSLGEYGVRDV